MDEYRGQRVSTQNLRPKTMKRWHGAMVHVGVFGSIARELEKPMWMVRRGYFD